MIHDGDYEFESFNKKEVRLKIIGALHEYETT